MSETNGKTGGLLNCKALNAESHVASGFDSMLKLQI